MKWSDADLLISGPGLLINKLKKGKYKHNQNNSVAK